MTTRTAARRPAAHLPPEPPTLILEEPPLRPAGVFNPRLPVRERCYVGNPKNPSATVRYVLRATYVRDSLQTLLYAGRRWWVWAGETSAWQAMDPEELEAVLYRALRENRWAATPKHVAALVTVAKMELRYPPPEMRCAA